MLGKLRDFTSTIIPMPYQQDNKNKSAAVNVAPKAQI